MALAWIEILDGHGIPWIAYEACYRRAMENRTALLARGEDVRNFTATDMAAVWIGPDGVAEEFKTRRPALKRADCDTCANTGWQQVTRGRYTGVIRCGCGW